MVFSTNDLLLRHNNCRGEGSTSENHQRVLERTNLTSPKRAQPHPTKSRKVNEYKYPRDSHSGIGCCELQITWHHVQHVGDILHGSSQGQDCNDHANAWLRLIWYKWAHYPAIYQEQLLHNTSLHYRNGVLWLACLKKHKCRYWTGIFFQSSPLWRDVLLVK